MTAPTREQLLRAIEEARREAETLGGVRAAIVRLAFVCEALVDTRLWPMLDLEHNVAMLAIAVARSRAEGSRTEGSRRLRILCERELHEAIDALVAARGEEPIQ